MKIKNAIKLIAISACLFVTTNSAAKSPVFKITKGDNHLYIGGTIHLLSPNDYPLPDGFTEAFDASDRVFFETDTSKMSSPTNQVKIASIMTFQNGETLQSSLNQETYSSLERFLTERQIPIASFNRFTPAAVSLTVTLLEIQRLGLGNPESGVDKFYENKAKAAEVPVSYLESVEEQISFLNSFNSLEPNLIINSSLNDLDSLQNNWKLTLAAWRAGNFGDLSSYLNVEQLKEQFPSIFKVLLTDRNNRWMAQIKPMLESSEVELILVGALHLVEDNGLIKQLQKLGYKVEQLD